MSNPYSNTKTLERYKFIMPLENSDFRSYNIQWQITKWCNYYCPYCIQSFDHHYADKPEETEEHTEKVANEIRKRITGKKVRFSFLGGEVSVHFDLGKIAEILFKDNDVRGCCNLTTNLSGDLQNYISYASQTTPSMKCKITASYQWRDLDSFVKKCNVLKEIDHSFQVTCVVWDKTKLEDMKHLVEVFKSNEIRFRFTIGRVPKSMNKFFDISQEIKDYIKEIDKGYKSICHTVYTNGEEKFYPSRSILLDEIAKFQGNEGANLKGYTCWTGVMIYPNGSVYHGTCPDRKNMKVGKIFDENVTLEPLKKTCETDGFCNLCDSIYVWNGKL